MLSFGKISDISQSMPKIVSRSNNLCEFISTSTQIPELSTDELTGICETNKVHAVRSFLNPYNKGTFLFLCF